MAEPSPYELWKQAGGNPQRYRELRRAWGHLVPLRPGEKAEPLSCGWPVNRTTEAVEPDGERRVYPTQPCKRGCGAQVVIAVIRRRGRDPERIALDAEPGSPNKPREPGEPHPRYAPDVLLTNRGRYMPEARITKSPRELFGRLVWRRHVRTCPFPPPLEVEARKKAAERGSS